MITFTYEEARRRYTERYTHTDAERDPKTGLVTMVTYKPETIVNNHEMDTIFEASRDWDTVLRYMHAFIGRPGARKKAPVTLPELV